MFKPTQNAWIAYALTCGFMFTWVFSPLGECIEHFAAKLKPEYSLFAWPVCGIAFFWAVRLLLVIVKRRPSKTAN